MSHNDHTQYQEYISLQLEGLVADHKDKLKVQYMYMVCSCTCTCVHLLFHITLVVYLCTVQARCSDLATVTNSLQALLVSIPDHDPWNGSHQHTPNNIWSKLLSSTRSTISALSKHINSTTTKVKLII